MGSVGMHLLSEMKHQNDLFYLLIQYHVAEFKPTCICKTEKYTYTSWTQLEINLFRIDNAVVILIAFQIVHL